MKIAVVDDELVCSDKNKTIMPRNFSHFIVGEFSNTKNLLDSDVNYDILLLDIEMPNDDGILFAQEYLKKHQCIIFISSHNECVYDAFLPNVKDFIPKDKMEEILVPKIHEIVTKIIDNKYLKLRTNDGEHTFILNNILYFICEDECIVATMLKGQYRLTITSLKKLYVLLDENFFFISRNVIIHINHIHNFLKKTHKTKMAYEEVFTVSARKWSTLLREYNEMVFSTFAFCREEF